MNFVGADLCVCPYCGVYAQIYNKTVETQLIASLQ